MLQKNKYHRYINLPFEIRKPQICNVKPKELKHYDIPQHYDENMDKFLKPYNLKVINTEVFHTPGGQKLPIHIDDWKEDDHVKINISWGPPEGTTRWWKPNNFDNNEYNGSHNSEQDVNKLDYSNFSDRHHKSIIKTEEECELIYEANTDRPSLVNVGTFHSSYNPTKQGRWTLCFVLGYGLDNLLSWDEAENIFKDYIE